MYCSNCGTKNKDNKFCVNCGNKLDLVIENNVNKDNNGMKNASIILGVLGIISSMMIVFSPIGLILSIVGLILAICATKKIKNVLGIVLNSIGLFLSIVVISLFVLFIAFIVEEYDRNVSNDYHDNRLNIDDYFGKKEYYDDFRDIIDIF